MLWPSRFIRRIVVRRGGSVGEAILATPALRGLRFRYPDAWLVFETPFPELFEMNPFVNEAVRAVAPREDDLVASLSYEDLLPLRESIADIFCRCAGVPPQGRALDLYFSLEEQRGMLRRFEGLRRPVVTMQPWPGGSIQPSGWPMDRWEQLVGRLRKHAEATVVQLGLRDEPRVPGAVDWRGQTTLREAALAIRYAHLHLAGNASSGPMAHAVGTPAVLLRGPAHPGGPEYSEHAVLDAGHAALDARRSAGSADSLSAIHVDDVARAGYRMLRRQSPEEWQARIPGRPRHRHSSIGDEARLVLSSIGDVRSRTPVSE